MSEKRTEKIDYRTTPTIKKMMEALAKKAGETLPRENENLIVNKYRRLFPNKKKRP